MQESTVQSVFNSEIHDDSTTPNLQQIEASRVPTMQGTYQTIADHQPRHKPAPNPSLRQTLGLGQIFIRLIIIRLAQRLISLLHPSKLTYNHHEDF